MDDILLNFNRKQFAKQFELRNFVVTMGGQTQSTRGDPAGTTVYIWREPTEWIMYSGGTYHIGLISSPN